MEFLKTCTTNAQAIVRRKLFIRDGTLTIYRETLRLSHITPSQSPAPPPPPPRERETGMLPTTYAQSKPSCDRTCTLLRRMHRDRGYGCSSPRPSIR